MRTLLIYSTKEGHTARIAERIQHELKGFGHQVDRIDLDNPPAGFDPNRYEAVVVGGSIHFGKYAKGLGSWVKRNAALLNRVPSYLFTVCMAVVNARPEDRAEAEGYEAALRRETGWVPQRSAIFAGAILYTQYGFFMKRVIRGIARKKGTATDMSRDHDYTDYEKVGAFARQVGEELAREKPALSAV